MITDTETIELLTRVTARVSALVFAGYLVSHAWTSRARRTRLGASALFAFLSVALLASFATYLVSVRRTGRAGS